MATFVLWGMMPHRDYNIEIIEFHLITLRFPPPSKAPYWVVVRKFRTTTFCFTIRMYWQLCRNHELHYANSSTSFHDFIYFIELTHSAAVAEGDECDSWRSRMQWLKETNAIAEGVECDSWRSRMQWLKETNAMAEGVEWGGWRRRMLWLEEKTEED